MDFMRFFNKRPKAQSHHGSSLRSHKAIHERRKYLPLLANPINKNARYVASGTSDLEKSTTDSSETLDATTLSGSERRSRGNAIIYKQHHEASTIELFYDLFFVANLAYFTAMYQHTDAESLLNYLKLFTLMWFTWLNTTLFDVRFSIDCVWYRLHKAIQFGVFTAFVFAGPVFDKYDNSKDIKSYEKFSIVLVISRIAVAIQYAVVLWQGRMFKQTLVPVGLSMSVHALAALAYGIVAAVLPVGQVGLGEQLAWVIIAIAEGLLIFLIAIKWRIVSFKYTHLVERLQLLTLIVIGEGIIGMVKSVASIVKGQTSNNASEFGTVTASVVLLYLLWMLYFDQHSHDRFGTVRQQLWSILHYPLHMAILLCVEGNTSLIVWNTAVQGLKMMWSFEPDDYSDPASGFDSTGAFISHLNASMYTINGRFSKYWNETYNWNTNFTAIENYTAAYGFRSDEWNNKTGELLHHLWSSAQVFVFQAHADSLAKLNAVSAPAVDPQARLDRVFDVFNVTVMQFYIGAGSVLLVLAVLFWFNKLHKTKYEFGEIINRVLVGFALIIVGIATVMSNKTTSGVKFVASHWLIPIVVLCFALVLVLDNLLRILSPHKFHHGFYHHGGSWTGSSFHHTPSDSQEVLVKQQKGSPPISRTQTAYTPTETPLRMYNFDGRATSSHKPKHHPHHHVPSHRQDDEKAYQIPPLEGLGDRIVVSPLEPQSRQRPRVEFDEGSDRNRNHEY